MSIWSLSVALIWAAGVPVQPTPHEERSHDPWMPRSATPPAGVIVRCDPIVRGPYRSVQVNVDHRGCNIPGDAANEPSIAIDPTDPRKVVIGWRQFDTVESSFRQAGWAYSHDAGHTWVFRGSINPGVFSSDPVLDADAGGTFYHFGFGSIPNLFRSNDGGVTWDDGVIAPGGDKPWMAIDRTEGIGRGNIYLFWTTTFEDFSRSTDGGATFDAFELPAGANLSWGTMSVGPDGTLYIVRSLGVEVLKSANAQDPQQIPNFDLSGSHFLDGILNLGWPMHFGLLGQAWVATDHSERPTHGNVYLLASVCRSPCQGLDDQGDVMFARSTDAGVTWSDALRVNDDPEDVLSWQWFAMMSVAPNGRIDAVWNDTRSNPGLETANLSELFYSFSMDAGVTWSKNIPVSPVFDSHVGWPNGQDKLGDYYHMLSDNQGVNVAYAATFNGEQDVYFLRIGPWDCNGNEIPDEDDIAQGTSSDCNANEVPDECEFRGDFDGDHVTTLADVAALQRCFSGDTVSVADRCCLLFDFNEDGAVSLADLATFHRVFDGP